MPQEETVGAFGELVTAGKARYVGCSNAPAWRIERARGIARAGGGAPYCCVQQRHSYLLPRPGTGLGRQLPSSPALLDSAPTRASGCSPTPCCSARRHARRPPAARRLRGRRRRGSPRRAARGGEADRRHAQPGRARVAAPRHPAGDPADRREQRGAAGREPRRARGRAVRRAARAAQPPDAPRPDQRPVVEERGRLLPRRRDLPPRLRRPDRPHRPRRRPRRHLHLADAVLPDAQPGRRLRHQRLPRRRPAARRPRRRARGDPPRDRPRAARARRPGLQPHLDPAPVVPGRPRRPRLAVPRLLRVERRPLTGEGDDARQLDVRRRGRPLLHASLPALPARPRHHQPRGPPPDRQDRRLLAADGRLGLPHGRRPVHGRDRRHRGGRLRRSPAAGCTRCASSRCGGAATRC